MPCRIMKRGKLRYRASVTVRGITRQHLFPDATKKSYRKAVAWENKERTEIEEELSQIGMVSLVMSEWTNEYLADAENRFVLDTLKEKKSAFTRFFTEMGIKETFPIEGITLTMCRTFLMKQAQERSGYAANKDRKNLGAAWKWGLQNLDGWPKGENPFLSVKKYPETRSPRYVPAEENYWKVYKKAKGQDKIMLLAFLHLAARRSEVFRLTWDDVDFNDSRIRLWTQKRECGNREFDWLPMTADLQDALMKWKEEQITKSGLKTDHVFVCLDDTPFCEEYYGKPFKVRQHFMERLCERAGVKPFGFHAIRHLSASVLYKKGYSISIIQAILRHRNPNTTARYLRSLGLEETRKALEEGLKGPAKVLPFRNKNKGGNLGKKTLKAMP